MASPFTNEQVQAAHWVLNVAGMGGQEPGSFTTHLIRALFSADRTNFAKVRREYPEIVEAVDLYKNVEGGVDQLRARAAVQ